jgi:cyanophycinase
MACLAHAESYKYFRLGNKEDVQTKPLAGIAMMGGGSDLDEAFSWLCDKGNGGDFLILRARGDDDYNPYVKKLCKANSVATLIIANREAAEVPAVAEIIRKAEVLFIAGGDQAN